MLSPIWMAGIGTACSLGSEPQQAEDRARRLHAALAALSQGRVPIRLFHPLEEIAVLAAHEALADAGVPTPYRSADIGITLGVEEGIDGIKARYYRGVLRDGPLGASPISFPFTTPNTIAARISILFDLRGEMLTVGGGSLSGAHAMGLARQALREGRSTMVLAGGVTSVEQEFLDAVSRVSRPGTGQLGDGACLFLLESRRREGKGTGGGHLLGYGQGFGVNDVQDAIQACLADAEVLPGAIESVRTAAVSDWRVAVEAIRETGVTAAIVRSPSSGLHSASFPLAVAEAVRERRSAHAAPVLVLGVDCLAGAAAAVVQGGG